MRHLSLTNQSVRICKRPSDFFFCNAASAIQVEVLRNFLEQKNKEKASTEARTKEAEKKLSEVNSSLEKVCFHFPFTHVHLDYSELLS